MSFVKQCVKCKSEKTFSSVVELSFYDIRMYRELYSQMKYKVTAIDGKFRDDTREQRKKMAEKAKPSPKILFR